MQTLLCKSVGMTLIAIESRPTCDGENTALALIKSLVVDHSESDENRETLRHQHIHPACSWALASNLDDKTEIATLYNLSKQATLRHQLIHPACSWALASNLDDKAEIATLYNLSKSGNSATPAQTLRTVAGR